MADAQILAAGQASSPLDYLVPNAQEIVLNAVRAVFDGTGAAGAFLPCVTVVSDAGVEVASAIGSAVSAGGSADASFFPGMSAAAQAAAGAGLPVASLRQTAGHLSTITAAGGQTYVSLQNGVNAHFATTDATVFDNSSTTLFTGSPLYGVGVLAVGTYRYDWNVFYSSGGTAGNTLLTYWSSSGTALLSALQQGRVQCTMQDTWDKNESNHNFWTEWQSFVNPGDVPGVAVPYAQINGGASVTLGFDLIVTQVSPTAIADL